MKDLRKEQIEELEMDVQYHRSMIDSSMGATTEQINEHQSEIEYLHRKLETLKQQAS